MYNYLLEELSKAIGARLLVQFQFNGKLQVVEPHLLGRNQQHQDCLYAWRLSQDGEKNEGWHCFPLCQLQQMQLLETRFSRQRPGYDPYNNTMSRIYYRI